MSWGKFLLGLVLCVGGMQGAVITSGYVTEYANHSSYYDFSGPFQLIVDGLLLGGSGNYGQGYYQCFAGDGPTCSVNTNIYFFGGLENQVLSAIGYQLFDTLITFNSGLLTLTDPTEGLQVYALPFTVSGTLNVYPYFDPRVLNYQQPPPCIVCNGPVSGSGLETVTVLHNAASGLYTVQSINAQISSTPEPATPILITAGIGVLALLRKRLSGCRLR